MIAEIGLGWEDNRACRAATTTIETEPETEQLVRQEISGSRLRRRRRIDYMGRSCPTRERQKRRTGRRPKLQAQGTLARFSLNPRCRAPDCVWRGKRIIRDWSGERLSPTPTSFPTLSV